MSAYYNHDAEAAVLAALTTGKRDVAPYVSQLTIEDFHAKPHKAIFAAIQRLNATKQAVTAVTIAEATKQDDALMAELIDIQRAHAVDGWAVQSHIDIVKAASLRRELYKQLNRACTALDDPASDVGAVLESTRQGLREMCTTRHAWHDLGSVLSAAYEAIEQAQQGKRKAMPSGVQALDRLTSGFHRGELTIIGARPAVGKSALGMHIALATAAQGYKVGICSREMTDIQYGTRILGSRTDIEPGKLRTGNLDPEEWVQLAQSLASFSEHSMAFVFSARDIEDLRMEVQNRVDAGELDMLVVDYLQLMQSRQRFDKDYARIGYVSKMLKDMTTDFNIPIIALAQVGRSGANSMPSLSELRGSGDIEQDADNVIFMHRPEDPSDDSVRPGDADLMATLKDQGLQYIAIDLAKQRQGQTATLQVAFDPAHMRYTGIARN